MDFSRHIYATCTKKKKKLLHLKLLTCDISWHRLQNDSAVVIEENYSFESFVHKYTDILICTVYYSRYMYFMHNAILSPS